MAEFNITSELAEGLLKAQSIQEVKDLLAASGEEFAEEDAGRVWEEIEHHRVDYEQELSDDELEAVAGGRRDKNVEGCAATTYDSGWCWSDDQCIIWDVQYENTDPKPDKPKPERVVPGPVWS